ncbi:hypothetical protein Syn7502_01122 [Synechococcus sp. PCC 7502]|uniref:hypothetical protein n=1 Tax=Synechococcus sp. PCC 7502 TaxID=1173263 RepID=UPI00029FE427|nr:hypothetical protein [Synechococcus sp. PCC 7502]AFY73231.1 hypothetical protein Syn7502_01122 [Synechococcus sp. PCC 7502]
MDSQSFLDFVLLPQLVQKTTQILESAIDELLRIRWTDSEANTDSDYSRLACQKFEEAFRLSNHKNIEIVEIKSPDIQITFSDGNHQFKRKVELKSCKDSSIIPGSTISKLDFNIWVIFCCRSSNNSKFEFRYGRYYLGITTGETDLFQDRTPRPRLSWGKFQSGSESPKLELMINDKDWIKKYARAAINRIYQNNIKYSWQDDLVREIIKIALQENITIEDLNTEVSDDDDQNF